ncbi:MAG: PhoH family protein [Polyangiaceae bacterium]|nr:PhoH family protein [Polyangiaceae bacterium]MBK8995224.1 PhoH family protein [Myxococcales bacterium]MCE7894731.1 PhoH family protein [Sorangiineae bacterium PRO1]MCL4750627.1 PhoH family protein [Myxococcales bacterium]
MKKNYVLDTNVLLHDPYALFKFEDNDLILPIYVLEEIDQFKRDNAERGRNARTVSRLLDGQREKYGSLSEGVKTGEGGTLRVYVPSTRPEVKIALRPSSGDHAILQCAVELRDQYPDRPTIFVTMDVNLRIRADAFGLRTEAYENQSVDVEHLDTGVVELPITAEEMDRFFETGAIPANGRANLYANVCVLLRDDSPRQRTGLARFHAEKGEIRALRTPREGLSGIRPRNKEQSFALDLLLDDSIRLVTMVGKAGTGKTLLALAAGLRRTVDDGAYARLLVSRPVMPMGRDLGFLPGDIDEKLNPWMQPIFDNLEFLLAAGGGKRRGVRGFEELLESGQIQVEPLTYIRGRSLPQQYVIVDEAQNLTPHEVKTVITRCGEGTKIVLTGDPFQIDNPYVDSATNGLSVALDRLRGENITAHMLLAKGERSELANIAANKL